MHTRLMWVPLELGDTLRHADCCHRRMRAAWVSVVAALAFGQNPQTVPPRFQIADVHASGPPGIHWRVFRAGRDEIPYATMLELIETAYSVDPDTVVGGPPWLDFDRFDVIAKTPPATSLTTTRLMLQEIGRASC